MSEQRAKRPHWVVVVRTKGGYIHATAFSSIRVARDEQRRYRKAGLDVAVISADDLLDRGVIVKLDDKP